MTKPPEHDTTCHDCGVHVPAGTPQHRILGPGPTCEPCGIRGRDGFIRWKRRGAEHNRRIRQAEELEVQKSDYAWEGGALGGTRQCYYCGSDYCADRLRHFFPRDDVCEVCEDRGRYDYLYPDRPRSDSRISAPSVGKRNHA